ncbi:hypothetical protein R5W24_003532 [Gemmata sp. JC717]|uniref:hypothetical protein n=1 Tax=Gemmata algarum TaxID=2975278 RepID=UPI0021BBA2EB|nr:hypothetical protein [Gemmata algarum]MDY3554410.1 hypothetical protein [Gemmata algarum]
MGRRAGVIVAGAVIGLIAGALAPVVFIAACVWDGRAKWSAITEPESAPYLATLVALGAVNGAVGAWDGWRSSRYRVWPVAWAPALLFLFPAVQWVQDSSDSKTWGAALLAVGIVAPFVWVAGRVGQEVGVRVPPRPAEPGAAPDAAG